MSYCCKRFESAIKEGVFWKETNNVCMSTTTTGTNLIYYGISYCPFCGKQLVIDENKLELIES